MASIGMKTFVKDPDAVLRYTVDWRSKFLEPGEAISIAVFIVPEGLTKDSETNDGDTATVWLSGGTLGEKYTVTCRVTTSSNPARIQDQSFVILCQET